MNFNEEHYRKMAAKLTNEQLIANLDYVEKIIDDDIMDDFILEDVIMETYQILRDECEERIRKGLS